MGELHQDVVLNLTISHDLLAPNFLVQHMTANHSWFEDTSAYHQSSKYFNPSASHYRQSTKESHNSLANCIYTGVVVGDKESNIVLNLCHGLVSFNYFLIKTFAVVVTPRFLSSFLFP